MWTILCLRRVIESAARWRGMLLKHLTPEEKKDFGLEERRLVFEHEARTRELDLKEREIAAMEKEVSFKEKEIKTSRWVSPTVIGVYAAALGLAANVVVAWINNSNSIQMERAKEQSSLVFEAIKTGSSDKACQNLLFFVNLRLLKDPDEAIKKQCSSAPKGPPSLPSFPVSYGDLSNLGVRGVVLDADTGKPIQGATVTLQHALVNTADDGRFFLKMPDGYFENKILVQKEGYQSESVVFNLFRMGEPLTVRLKKLK
jgi:hypothetical protein